MRPSLDSRNLPAVPAAVAATTAEWVAAVMEAEAEAVTAALPAAAAEEAVKSMFPTFVFSPSLVLTYCTRRLCD